MKGPLLATAEVGPGPGPEAPGGVPIGKARRIRRGGMAQKQGKEEINTPDER